MKKVFVALSLIVMFCSIWLGNITHLRAQLNPQVDRTTTQVINLSNKSPQDRSAFRPSDRRKSERPFNERERAIIGNDDRVPVLSREYPWSAIGRLEYNNSRQCTGSLIGRDLVLTNAHCLLNMQSFRPLVSRHSDASTPQLIFKPSLIKGIAIDSARVIDYQFGTIDPGKDDWVDDWALLKLDQPLGDIYGYLGWRSLDFSDSRIRQATRNRLTLVGYATDYPSASKAYELGNAGETAGMHWGCSIDSIVSSGSLAKTIMHQCDSNPGASGGPIFAYFPDNDSFDIVALHAGWANLSQGKKTIIRNRGVQVSRWANQAIAWR